MPFLGASALHHAVYRRPSLVPATALLLGANYLLGLGFLNYLFMMGLAIILFALWIATTTWPRARRAALFTPLATLLYLGHAFAFLGYGLAIAGFEFFQAFQGKFRPTRVAVNLLAAATQALPALALAATLNTQAGAPGKLYSHYGDIGEKLLALAAPVLFLADRAQFAILLACIALAGLCAARLKISAKIWPAALAAGLAAAAMPEILASTWLTDFRLPLFTLTLLIGGLAFSTRPRWHGALPYALAALLAAKSLDTWRVLRTMDGQIAEMRQVLAFLPQGARLLVANASAEPAGSLSGSTIWTMPLLAIIDRNAFVPYLFTGLTTVHMRAPFAAASTPQGNPVTLRQLTDDLAGRPPALSPAEQREGLRIYWHGWPQNFDYLLVEHFFADAPAGVPENVKLVAEGRDVGLYKLVR
jgi:hypothetical protein